MRFVFLGPPGVGKGTQAKILCEKWGLPHISTGDILRRAIETGSPLGLKIKDIIDKGELVSDELVQSIVEDRLQMSDCHRGFVLDGFPRTLDQAVALAEYLEKTNCSLSAVVFFEIMEEALVARLEGRRSLEHRADDSAEVQRQRLKIYHDRTFPLLDYYTQRGLLLRIDSGGDVAQVSQRMLAAVDCFR